MTPPARRLSGFTLVELMIVVAIIGILSSVAMPVFKDFTLRARQSERRLIMRTVKQSAEDYYVRYGRIEDSSGAALGVLIGVPNPPAPPSGTKRPYNPAAAGWGALGVNEQLIDGSLYYQYSFLMTDAPGNQVLWVTAEGDLDDDGRKSYRHQLFELKDQVYVLSPAGEWPPGGQGAEDMDVGGVPTW